MKKLKMFMYSVLFGVAISSASVTTKAAEPTEIVEEAADIQDEATEDREIEEVATPSDASEVIEDAGEEVIDDTTEVVVEDDDEDTSSDEGSEQDAVIETPVNGEEGSESDGKEGIVHLKDEENGIPELPEEEPEEKPEPTPEPEEPPVEPEVPEIVVTPTPEPTPVVPQTVVPDNTPDVLGARVPKTGDESQIGLYLILMLLSGMGLILVGRKRA